MKYKSLHVAHQVSSWSGQVRLSVALSVSRISKLVEWEGGERERGRKRVRRRTVRDAKGRSAWVRFAIYSRAVASDQRAGECLGFFNAVKSVS